MTTVNNENKVTRAEFLRICGAAAAAAGLGLTPSVLHAATKETEALRIGYIPITDAAPLLIAYAKGFYSGHGVKAERPVLIRDWSTISEAFMAGRFNLVHLLMPITIYMRYSKKFKVKVVAWDHMNNSAITVSEKSGINSLADLGGKSIAVPYWYSMHNIILQLCLRNYGIKAVTSATGTPAPDQTHIMLMKPPDMPNAMAGGAIDGYIVAEPFNAVGELLAHGKILRFTGDIWKNHPCCVAVMKDDDIVKRRLWSQNVVTALVEAEQWIKNNKAETAHILSREGDNFLPLPEKVLLKAMNDYEWKRYGTEGGSGAMVHKDWDVERIGFQPYPFRSATEKMVELMKETVMEGDTSFLRQLSGAAVADDLIDYDLVRRAIEKTGGMGNFGCLGSGEMPYTRKETIAL